MSDMYKINQEKLIPTASPLIKHQETRTTPDFQLSVNPLFLKPKDPYDIRISQLTPDVKEKNVKKFNSFKQEQHYRLNRDNKLKINEEITNYIQGTNKKQTNISSLPFGIRKNEVEQIKDATKQIAEINHILENRRTKFKKNNKTSTSLDNTFINGSKPKNSKKNYPESNMRHMCTKNFKSKVQNYNTIIENFEKQLRLEEEKLKKSNKYCLSSPDIIKPGALKKLSNKNSKTNINTTLDAINTRLSQSKEKFLEKNVLSHDPKKITNCKTNNSKTDYFTKLRKGPKYKSIKDLKLDQEKIRQYEAEVKMKFKMEDDPKETKVLYENEVFKKSVKNSFREQNYTLDLIKNNSCDTQTETTPLERYSSNEEDLNEILSPKVQLPVLLNKLTPRTPRHTSLLSQKPKSSLPDSNTIGISTEPEDELQKSIMKSDFLMKEFSVNPQYYSPPNTIQDKYKDNVKKEAEIVNWADKFKIEPPKKWPRDLDYLMS